MGNKSDKEVGQPKAKAAAKPGECLSLSRAGQIVQQCSNGPHDVDDTLEEVGFITDNQRLVFRECVFLKILDNGCKISREDIPHDADTSLRDVRNTISDLAG